MKVYKVLGENGRAFHGGSGSWPLPNGKPGDWVEVRPDRPLIPCQFGLHLCRRGDLLSWLGPAIFLAEYEGEKVVAEDKIIVRKARLLEQLPWNETTARLFAADCAEYAVRKCQKVGISVDQRVIECYLIVRRYARGEVSAKELSAAGSAAWSAAESAAWSAAGSAAGSAAESAAWSAAESAAWSAAGSWQTKRLHEYLSGARS